MFTVNEMIQVCDKYYYICDFLGRGKNGYSYLVKDKYEHRYVLKQIHHEPCEFSTYDNKIEVEQKSYHTLLDIGLNIPTLYFVDNNNDRLLKEYIEGDTIYDLLKSDVNVEMYIEQMKKISDLVKSKGYNLDYLSTNYVVNKGLLWYVDYECNTYEKKWDFDSWGVKFWSKTREYMDNIEKYK